MELFCFFLLLIRESNGLLQFIEKTGIQASKCQFATLCDQYVGFLIKK